MHHVRARRGDRDDRDPPELDRIVPALRAQTPQAVALLMARGYPLVTVNGGDPPRSEPCEAMSAHGYLGRETPTVDAIANWMLAKPYAANIE